MYYQWDKRQSLVTDDLRQTLRTLMNKCSWATFILPEDDRLAMEFRLSGVKTHSEARQPSGPALDRAVGKKMVSEMGGSIMQEFVLHPQYLLPFMVVGVIAVAVAPGFTIIVIMFTAFALCLIFGSQNAGNQIIIFNDDELIYGRASNKVGISYSAITRIAVDLQARQTWDGKLPVEIHHSEFGIVILQIKNRSETVKVLRRKCLNAKYVEQNS